MRSRPYGGMAITRINDVLSLQWSSAFLIQKTASGTHAHTSVTHVQPEKIIKMDDARTFSHATRDN